jgi:threonine synthase
MFEKNIVCSDCGYIYKLNEKVFRCKKCGGSLEIIFDYRKLKKEVSIEKFRSRPFNHARYEELYPVKNMISLQEGGTPLLRSKNIERELKLNFELYFKYEALNPTGSFKDRGSSIEVAKALEFGTRNVICASTGNMGASVSAYSAVANLNCAIFIPQDALPIKLKQILAYGAKILKIKGDYTHAEKMVEYAFKRYGFYLLGDYQYRREGTKSVGFEIMDQLDFNTENTYIISPVGNGILISSIWKAINEFKTFGFIKEKPKLVCVQASGCKPVVNAFKTKGKVKQVENPHTIASAIECGKPLDGDRALKAVKESKGFAYAVSDKEIMKTREMLARMEGIFTEQAGAVALAGLLKFKDRIEENSKVVCLVTGHGLKEPTTEVRGNVKEIKADKRILKRIFR